LPASTQWELIEAASETPQLIYEALIGVAAQGHLLHNDDTHMRIQSVRQEIAAAGSEQERTGIFTTSIISKTGQRQIALFFTGQKHAGENLNQLLQRRAAGLDQPMQMCDALSRNQPKEFHTLLCHCLLHGRRQFVDVVENFPEECRKVIESLREVYRFDALTKEQKFSDLDRLAFHQAHSQPVMDDLQKWMQEQIEHKKVEPNSGLGEAIQYMLKRWQTLTRFLSVPGAPLDNNIAERALKMAILHRKNSLSFKTLHGARIGDVHMSLIHTCELNRVNPFDYLMALQQHAAAVAKAPQMWLPWNLQQTIAAADSDESGHLFQSVPDTVPGLSDSCRSEATLCRSHKEVSDRSQGFAMVFGFVRSPTEGRRFGHQSERIVAPSIRAGGERRERTPELQFAFPPVATRNGLTCPPE
jgi:hypothetical protein